MLIPLWHRVNLGYVCYDEYVVANAFAMLNRQ